MNWMNDNARYEFIINAQIQQTMSRDSLSIFSNVFLGGLKAWFWVGQPNIISEWQKLTLAHNGIIVCNNQQQFCKREVLALEESQHII